MNLVVIGGKGSIGKRRATILQDMGHKVKVLDVDDSITPTVLSKFDAVFICSPSAMHYDHLLTTLNANVPFFCEKPLCISLRDAHAICEIILPTSLVNMVACNVRFTEEYKYLKSAIANIGQPLYTFAEFGYYLPFWRKGDYRTYYSAYRASGGGVILDAIHEFDYLADLFGDLAPHNTMMMYKIQNTGELEVDVEDNVNVTIIRPTGHVIFLHLDYLQRTYQRRCITVGTKGRAEVVFNVQDSNTMYRNEMKHFLDCVKTRTDTCNTVFNHLKVMTAIEGMRNVKPKNTDPDSSSN